MELDKGLCHMNYVLLKDTQLIVHKKESTKSLKLL